MTEITPQANNARIDGMKAWAATVAVDINQLQKSLSPSLDEADAIVESMKDLEVAQTSRAGDMGTLLNDLADLRSDIAEQKEQVKEAETETLMFADGSNAEKRKGAAALKLKGNTEYQAVKAALSINERGKLVKQAHFDTAENEYKRLGEQLRNLRVRLENWTARAKMSIGE